MMLSDAGEVAGRKPRATGDIEHRFRAESWLTFYDFFKCSSDLRCCKSRDLQYDFCGGS